MGSPTAEQPTDILITGAGPAGLAAAAEASRWSGTRVTLLDENPWVGGQIWRPAGGQRESPEVRALLDECRERGVVRLTETRIVAPLAPGVLLAEGPAGPSVLRYRRLILATGARERFLPFPGWTLPGVYGAGGLQALVKGGSPIEGRRVVVAGSGPLLLAVAATLRRAGARVLLLAEQAPLSRMVSFGAGLVAHPRKVGQFLSLSWQLRGIPRHFGCYPVAAEGEERLAAVRLRSGAREWTLPCDALACGFHLLPNTELASLLGCRLDASGAVEVDRRQRTSVAEVFAVGEAAGIGGLETALIEGRLAGRVAAGAGDDAVEPLLGPRDRARRFAARLERAFALQEELRQMATGETIVCRCEDVTLGRLQRWSDWRSAKLQTRCGMGPCQGRICSPAVHFLLGWKEASSISVRPPVLPARVETLLALARSSSEESEATDASV